MGKHGYDSQESTRSFWKRIIRKTPAIKSLSDGIRRIAAHARTDQPVEAQLAAEMEATAALLRTAEHRAGQLFPVVQNSMRAENERHDAPRRGSKRIESKADAGHVIRGT